MGKQFRVVEFAERLPCGRMFAVVITLEVILVLSALCAVVSAWQRRASLKERWNASSTLIFLAGVALNPLHLVAVATGSYHISRDPISGHRSLVYGSLPGTVLRYVMMAALVITLVVILHRLANRRAVNQNALAALAVVFVIAVSSWYNGHSIPFVTLTVVVALLVLAAYSVPGDGARLGAASVGVFLAAASLFFYFYDRAAVTRPCGSNKCGPLDVLYSGAFINENALGLTLVVALPFVLTACSGSLRWWSAAFLSLSVYATGSRTSFIACLVTLAVFSVVALVRKNSMNAAQQVVTVAVLISASTALASPFVMNTPDIDPFTGRARLWWIALYHLNGNWFIGLGADGWRALQTTSALYGTEATYSPHNQWMDVLFAGGIVAAIALTVFIYFVARSGMGDERIAACLALVATMVVGTTERAWSFGNADWLFWTVLAACLVAAPARYRGATAAAGPSHPARSTRKPEGTPTR